MVQIKYLGSRYLHFKGQEFKNERNLLLLLSIWILVQLSLLKNAGRKKSSGTVLPSNPVMSHFLSFVASSASLKRTMLLDRSLQVSKYHLTHINSSLSMSDLKALSS